MYEFLANNELPPPDLSERHLSLPLIAIRLPCLGDFGRGEFRGKEVQLSMIKMTVYGL